VSLLLYHYAWSNVDHTAVPFGVSPSPIVSHDITSGLDLAADPLLNLSVGLRYLFWKTGALAADSDSPFRPYALEKPRAKIVLAVRRQQQQQDTLGQMESYLVGEYHSHGLSIAKELDSSALRLPPGHLVDDPVHLAAYSESAGRLAPILAVLSSSVDIRDEPVVGNDPDDLSDDLKPAVQLRDIIRYLFSYPIHFCDTFRSLVAVHDRRALFLLLHFFHAARRLLPPDRCWWSLRRALLLEHQLECMLNVQPAIPEQYAVMTATSLRHDMGTELVSSRLRDWLNGECIHGQF
jgi:hypothetical protein